MLRQLFIIQCLVVLSVYGYDYCGYGTYCRSGYYCCHYNTSCCLSAGPIIGIIFGCVVVVGIIIATVCICVQKSKRSQGVVVHPTQTVQTVTYTTAHLPYAYGQSAQTHVLPGPSQQQAGFSQPTHVTLPQYPGHGTNQTQQPEYPPPVYPPPKYN